MRSFPLLAFLAVSAAAQPSAPSLQNLIANSPFGSANQVPGGPAANTPLEFRGTFVDNGERFFSILDTASRRAEWVSLNESGRPFVVKTYDPERESITLDFQGRAMDLKLHSARITALPMPAVVNNPAQQPNAGGAAPGRPPQAQPSATEAQRLAQVAEEIRRRRALRQQAQQGNQPPVQPPPSNPPQPR